MRLGTRQVEVLRAAHTGDLVRYDDGSWADRTGGCTRVAESVTRRGLLAEGGRMVTITLGRSGGRPGRWMHLSDTGQTALDEWDVAHPEAAAARMRRDELARAIARSGRPITDVDILALAARDETLGDDAFVALRQAIEGRHGGVA